MIRKIKTLELTLIGTGMLCPFPIIGEGLLACGMYSTVKNIFGKGSSAAIASFAVAGLIRMKLYGPVYNPIMNYFR
jgi:hypothetical protein